MKRRLKNSAEAAVYRKELLAKQSNIDPIIGIPITKGVLDHQHYGAQHCREVLQNEVNAFEGRVVNNYKRMLSHLTDKPVYEVLRNLADYIERNEKIDPKDQVIHHTAITVDVKKFKRLPSSLQIEILKNEGLEPASNTDKRAKQIRALIKNNNFDITKYKK